MMITFALALVVGLLPLENAAFAVSDDNITITIHCSQGIVDAPHQVSVTVKSASTGISTSVTVGAPALSSTTSIASNLAQDLSHAGVNGTTSGETTNPKYGNSPSTAEDVNLPDGYEVTEVVVEKLSDTGWHADDGHLKAHEGADKVSNPILTGGSGFSEIHLVLNEFTGAPLAMEIDLYGYVGARESEWHKAVSYGHGPVQPVLRFLGVGNYLETLGFAVSYPAPNEMLATAPPQITLDAVYFAAFQETDQSSPFSYSCSHSMNVD